VFDTVVVRGLLNRIVHGPILPIFMDVTTRFLRFLPVSTGGIANL
jgi:hypothetical protein